MQVIGNVFLIDCAQNKHLISSVAAILATHSADKGIYQQHESLNVVNFSSGPNRPSGKAYHFTSEAASKAGKAAARSRQRKILTVTCSTYGQKLTAQELKQHVC